LINKYFLLNKPPPGNNKQPSRNFDSFQLRLQNVSIVERRLNLLRPGVHLRQTSNRSIVCAFRRSKIRTIQTKIAKNKRLSHVYKSHV
jgi:hypothetical protein